MVFECSGELGALLPTASSITVGRLNVLEGWAHFYLRVARKLGGQALQYCIKLNFVFSSMDYLSSMVHSNASRF
jgi:hypothetical protein